MTDNTRQPSRDDGLRDVILKALDDELAGLCRPAGMEYITEFDEEADAILAAIEQDGRWVVVGRGRFERLMKAANACRDWTMLKTNDLDPLSPAASTGTGEGE